MDLVIDRKLCINSGMCTSIAPEVFDLDDKGVLTLVRAPGSEDWDAVRDAAACCPVEALRIERAALDGIADGQ